MTNLANMLNSGTLAAQDASNVTITGGSINNANIGVTSPATGLFSNLSWPIRAVLISSNTQINPASDLCTTFQVDTASVNITAQAYGNYQTNFQSSIKNSSNGNITFTPNAGDNVEGASSFVLAAGEAVTIFKSLQANSWSIINNYNTATTGNYLIKSNNLSDVTSAATSRSNLGLGTIATQAASFVAITGGFINGTTIGNITPAFVTATYIQTNVLTNTTNINNYIVDTVADQFQVTYATYLSGGFGTNASLPTWASTPDGFTWTMVNLAAGTASINAAGGENINGVTTKNLTQYQSMTVQKSPQSNTWSVIAQA